MYRVIAYSSTDILYHIAKREIRSDYNAVLYLHTAVQVPLLHILGNNFAHRNLHVMLAEIGICKVVRNSPSGHFRPYELGNQRITRYARIHPLERIQHHVPPLTPLECRHHGRSLELGITKTIAVHTLTRKNPGVVACQ